MSYTGTEQSREVPKDMPSAVDPPKLRAPSENLQDQGPTAVSTAWLAADALRDELQRFLRRRLYQRQAVEDVLQGFYLRVFENAHLLKNGRSTRSWLYRLLRSSLVDYARADLRQHDIAARIGSKAAPFMPESSFLDCSCTDMLDELKPEYSDILLRMRVRGDTAEEAAADLGTTPNNIRVRHFRARAALRHAYARTTQGLARVETYDPR